MKILFLLVCGHYLGDFALQNDFVAKFKAPRSADFWVHVMSAHCFIHAGIVFLVTNNIYCAVGEYLSHFIIDCLKCEKKIGFHADQFLHLLLKGFWFGIVSSRFL